MPSPLASGKGAITSGRTRVVGTRGKGEAAHVIVDPGRSLGQLDRRVFGGFVEHLGRCIDGGLLNRGRRTVTTGASARTSSTYCARSTCRSFDGPGATSSPITTGSTASAPARRGQRRVELAWGGVEPNGFGTDEFLAYCQELGAAPYICLNMGTGALSEALDWVEYCNSATGSYWADRRRQNGHEEPYGVTYWGLGNEMYGEWQVASSSAQEYVATARRWAKAIRRLDPSVRLVSCGLNGWSDWDRTVIDGLTGLVDLHSLHIYTGSDDYWTNLLSPHQVERAVNYTSAFLSQAAYKRHQTGVPRIAYDEWNVWYRTDDSSLEERYSFDDTLAVATYLNIFVRQCHWVKMANLAQLVNAIAPIVTTPDGAFVQPIYYPFVFHSRSALDEAVDARVEGPTISAPAQPEGRWGHQLADLSPFSVIDAAATADISRSKVCVALVNRGRDESETVELCLRDFAFSGGCEVRTLTEEPDRLRRPRADIPGVKVEEGRVDTKANVSYITLPSRSFTVMEANIVNE